MAEVRQLEPFLAYTRHICHYWPCLDQLLFFVGSILKCSEVDDERSSDANF
jgi:hypothetical protein